MAFVIKPDMRCNSCSTEWKEGNVLIVKCPFCESKNVKSIKE